MASKKSFSEPIYNKYLITNLDFHVMSHVMLFVILFIVTIYLLYIVICNISNYIVGNQIKVCIFVLYKTNNENYDKLNRIIKN